MTATTPSCRRGTRVSGGAADPDGDARDPYWLYALSNCGSLVSLLAYPFMVEQRSACRRSGAAGRSAS